MCGDNAHAYDFIINLNIQIKGEYLFGMQGFQKSKNDITIEDFGLHLFTRKRKDEVNIGLCKMEDGAYLSKWPCDLKLNGTC